MTALNNNNLYSKKNLNFVYQVAKLEFTICNATMLDKNMYPLEHVTKAYYAHGYDLNGSVVSNLPKNKHFLISNHIYEVYEFKAKNKSNRTNTLKYLDDQFFMIFHDIKTDLWYFGCMRCYASIRYGLKYKKYILEKAVIRLLGKAKFKLVDGKVKCYYSMPNDKCVCSNKTKKFDPYRLRYKIYGYDRLVRD